jgi:hypothetical protein
MPYPPQNRNLAEEEEEPSGGWNLLKAFNTAVYGPFADPITDLQKKAVDAAGEGLNFALGRQQVPFSAAIAATDVAARGGSVSEEDLQAYAQKADLASPIKAASPFSVMLRGMEGAETIWNYAVNRPIGTAALLSDPDSPLYNGNPIRMLDKDGNPISINTGKGFQIKDIVNAWNRTEKVSAGQAIAANNLVYSVPMIGGVAPIFSILGGVNQYDPWDDDSMMEAQNNPFYVALTGGTDLGIQIALPPAVRATRLAAMRNRGLTNTIRSAEELKVFRNQYQAHTPDSPNTWGQAVQDLAAETNTAKIRQHPMVANNIGADKGRLSNILAQTDDPNTVNEILLANMGDLQAIRTLAVSAPDHVWTLAQVDEAIKVGALEGRSFRPVGDDLAKTNQVFDSALTRDSYFKTLKEELTSPDGSLKLNSTWRPTSSLLVEKIRKGGREIGYAAKTGDWSEAPQWIAQRLTDGKGTWATSRIQWAGSRSPLGHVSNSGARPEEKLTEFKAQMDSVPEFRGNRPIIIDDQEIPAFQWRQNWEQRFIDARDAELPDLWTQMETEAMDIIAKEVGIEPEVAVKIADIYRTRIGDEMQYLRDSNGYLFDEELERFIVEPVTARQMLGSFQTLPLEEIRRHMIENTGFLKNATYSGQDVGIDLYDFVQKIFRTDVLFRPGYTGKNSILEPLLSRFIAHGTILTDEGLWATVGNVTKNLARTSKRIAYYGKFHKLIDSSLRTGAKRDEVKRLLAERHDLQKVMESAIAEIDSWNGPDAWPRMEAMYGPEVRGALFNAQKRIESIEATFDGLVPEWRQIVEPATLTDLRQKLVEFKAIVGDNPDYLDTLRMQRDQIVRDARARTLSPRQRAEGDLAALEDRMSRLREREQTLSEEYQAGSADLSRWSVARDGKQVATGEAGETGDLARGRDYQAVALKRQIESLQEQIDVAREKVNSSSSDVNIVFTPNEQVTINGIDGVLDRAEIVAARGLEGADPVRADIAKLEQVYDEIVASKEMFDEDNVPYRISLLSDSMEELEGRLALAQAELRETEGRIRKIGADTGTKNYAGTGEGDMVIVIGGERYVVPKAFDQREYNYGAGYRAEASAQTTNRLTLDPSYRGDYETGRWQRSAGPDALDANHEAYFDTLAHVGNRFFRGDRLIQKILDGWSRERLVVWLRSPEGKVYQDTVGADYLTLIENFDPIATATARIDRNVSDVTKDVTNIKGKAKPTPSVMGVQRTNQDIQGKRTPTTVLSSSTAGIDKIMALVYQYFPDENVRKQLAAGELSAGDLQAALGGRTDLARIGGQDFVYIASRMTRVQNALNRALDKVWQWIATMPEDRIARWPFYQYEFRNQLSLRGGIIGSQIQETGARMTDEQWNALRQGAHRAALQELEKTFYNIRRYSTPVYNSRFLTTFPGALFNSIYRWSRFFTRETERVVQIGVLGGSMIKNLSVDEEGNPVKNIGDAKYLIVPFTGKYSDAHAPAKKVRISSFETIFPDLPSASIGVMSVATLAQKVNTNFSAYLDKTIGPVKETLFPYGISDNVISNFAGGWQRDAWRWANQFLGVNDEDRNRAMIQIYDYRMYEWLNSENPDPETMPTIDDAAAEAGTLFGIQAVSKFWSPFSIKDDVPGAWFANEWTKVLQQNDFDSDKATEQFLKLYGNEAMYFTLTDQKRTTYIPPTLEAYNRIFTENPELAKQLVRRNPDNPEYVGLLAYGTAGEYSREVSDALRTTPLPGDDLPVLSTMTASDYEAYRLKEVGWDSYTKGRVRYDAEKLRLAELRDAADNETLRQEYRNQIAYLDSEWASWVETLKSNNPAFETSFAGTGGDTAETASDYLNDIISDPDFIQRHKDDPAWQKVAWFLSERDRAKNAYKSISKNEDKKFFKEQFVYWVQSNLVKDDPDFADLWARYFASEWQTIEMKVEESAQ